MRQQRPGGLLGTRALLILFLVIGAVVRFGTLDVQSLWYDEAVSASLVRTSFADMLRALPHSESTPPLWYVLEWIWVRPFGTSELALRSLSAICGTLLIIVAFEATRTLLRRDSIAIAVAAVTAVSPILVWYSQEARAYALYALLSALSLLCFAKALREATPGWTWAWAVTSALAIATHYFAGFLVVAELAVLVTRLGGRRVAAPAALVFATAAALAPLALYQNEHVVAGLSIGTSSLTARLRETVIRFVVMFTEPGGSLVLVVALVAAGILAWRARGLPGVRTALFIGAAAVGVPVVLAATRAFDLFNFRNALAAWLPLVIVVLAGLPAGRLGVAVAAAIVGALLIASIGIAVRVGPQRDSWRDVARVVQEVPSRRLVVGETGELKYTLSYYIPGLRPLPPAGAIVRDIDLVGHVDADWRLQRLPEFKPVGAEKAGNLTVVRFEARRPMRVTSEQIDPTGKLVGRVAPLTEREEARRP
jgi:hypothetical protein